MDAGRCENIVQPDDDNDDDDDDDNNSTIFIIMLRVATTITYVLKLIVQNHVFLASSSWLHMLMPG
jgi:hypothetical protein